MTTRGLTALLWLGLCCEASFVYANTSDLPIETALASVTNPITEQVLESNAPTIASNYVSARSSSILPDDTQILWPMMPEESLAKLAQTFYPDSPILAQRFTQKSIRLSRTLGINIEPNAPFQHAQIIAIPNEKEVRALTHRIKKRDDLVSEPEQLQLSYQLKNASPTKTLHKKSNEHAVKSTLNQVPIALQLPEISVPKVSLPTLNPPKLRNISDHFNQAWHNIVVQLRYVWQTSKKTVMSWQTYALGMTEQLNTQHTVNMLGSQQVRIVTFAGGLVLFGLLLWQLQRRYLQRKIALLNTIESTLTESGLMEPTIGELPVAELNEQIGENQTNFNSEIEQVPDVSNSAFQDTETFLENLPADRPYSDEANSNDEATRPEQNN